MASLDERLERHVLAVRVCCAQVVRLPATLSNLIAQYADGLGSPKGLLKLITQIHIPGMTPVGGIRIGCGPLGVCVVRNLNSAMEILWQDYSGTAGNLFRHECGSPSAQVPAFGVRTGLGGRDLQRVCVGHTSMCVYYGAGVLVVGVRGRNEMFLKHDVFGLLPELDPLYAEDVARWLGWPLFAWDEAGGKFARGTNYPGNGRNTTYIQIADTATLRLVERLEFIGGVCAHLAFIDGKLYGRSVIGLNYVLWKHDTPFPSRADTSPLSPPTRMEVRDEIIGGTPMVLPNPLVTIVRKDDIPPTSRRGCLVTPSLTPHHDYRDYVSQWSPCAVAASDGYHSGSLRRNVWRLLQTAKHQSVGLGANSV
jgi:hypothetical protein